jgi:prepilin-type N-terminal cleavage/methylation domain-containing protein
MLKYRKQPGNRGDTLIEVLFAVAVFSLVAVGALSIMNQGTAAAERSLEITLVRQQIDAQAETLRYLNASYIVGGSGAVDWASIQKLATTYNASGATDFNSSSCDIPGKGVFVLNTHTASYVDPNDPTSTKGKPVPATTYSQVRYDGDAVSSVEGIWIQPVRYIGIGAQKGIGYIDFHIRACWDSPGQSFPVTIGTIVRLYEPQ